MSIPEPARSRQAPEHTAERRLAGWQRAVRWVLWLTFLGLAIWKSQNVGFGGLEFAALAAALGFSIWCMAKPLGGPKLALTETSHLLGTFESRTSWAMLLIGTLLTVGGVAGAGAAIYDSELEKTHAYALFLLIIPGLIMVAVNLTPLLKRGTRFRVEADGAVLVRPRDSWDPLLEYRYATVTADGSTIAFSPAGADGPPAVELPQARVFCQENGARLKPTLSADFFAGLLASRGFAVERTEGSSHFAARRK